MLYFNVSTTTFSIGQFYYLPHSSDKKVPGHLSENSSTMIEHVKAGLILKHISGLSVEIIQRLNLPEWSSPGNEAAEDDQHWDDRLGDDVRRQTGGEEVIAADGTLLLLFVDNAPVALVLGGGKSGMQQADNAQVSQSFHQHFHFSWTYAAAQQQKTCKVFLQKKTKKFEQLKQEAETLRES